MIKYIFLILFLFSNLAFSQTVNLIQNGDFERGKTGWVKSGIGSFSITSGLTALFGRQSARCSGVANGDYCESKPVVVPTGLLGRDGYAEIVYQYGEPNWVFKVMNGSTVLCSNTLAKSPTKTVTLGCYFVYPTLINSTIKIRIENTSAATTEYVDFDNVSITEAVKRSGTLSSEVQTYVPATQGLGTITNSEVYWSRNGSYLEVNGKFNIGTTSAVEARIYFPPGLTSENFTQGIRRAGEGIRVTTTSNDINVLVEPNVNYFTLDYQHDAGTTGITKQTGANIFVSGNTFTFQARVKIQGWVATDSFVEQRCKSELDCAQMFTADVTSAGVISNMSPPGWATSITKGATGFYDINYPNLGLSQYMDCTANSTAAATSSRVVSASSTATKTAYYIFLYSGTDTNTDHKLTCFKNGADRKERQTIQGSFYKPYASAWLSANFTASSTVPINFDSIEYTSASGLITPSATAWKFTAPESGVYQISGLIGVSSGSGQIMIYKNGSAYKTLSYIGGAGSVPGYSSATVKLSASDYIDFRPTVSLTVAGGSISTANVSHISIVKVAD